MSMMMAMTVASGGVVVNPLPGATVEDTAVDPADAGASLRFATDGTVQVDIGAGFSVLHNWFSPTETGIGSSYWVRATLATGTSPSGSALGSWLALTAARTWSLNRTTPGTTQCTLTLEIASDSAGTNIVAASAAGAYVLRAIVEIA